MGNGGSREMSVVHGLDLERYVGRWYEIASMPSFFQPSNGQNTRATYALNADNTVHVLNETWSAGKRSFIEGTAYKADPNNDEAKFKVKFYLPPFLPVIPVLGNYWVLYLDADYSYALVGEPSRKYLWILSRKTQISDATFNLLLEKAKEEGYEVEKLHKTPQTDPPPSSDATPTDKQGIWWIKSLFGK
ncbi:hypothetical protein KSP39_PZI001608 [Platanthera zijinensis]|uniref:Lipocalin/cytosolic fatty-acid binding domain-containing protein n=1 Tax=Platanthera zijinensis TaxID=2320716 RepID=A0AAP0C090_9ASPA